ncbi:hypothetical protein [Fluoribacter gormanii]|uniref:Uncharacterized protein n=1 Tax=Fluoribacter gormanii TaxID=464 RepID=A0A377GGC0_9GAMM|nr:hypothetical protein [Fluoribacter gormanii]KTD00223.1 hypothetical protein Lgor_3118 [Fluoribacter gormanii]MCW8444858.1 hypothetical protein [Fluoribacter gormanii]SIR91255.1 hypothetical protein SAMN05421777_14210 [Fluoribacter gormanii]STO23575.1 Uncharacterised protein [Fluoribacter gormanii]
MSAYQKGVLGDTVSHYFSKSLHHTEEFERMSCQLQNLVGRIEAGITFCKRQKERYPRLQQYSDKISVLNAAKNYVCGNIGLDLLEEYMRMYPKWDKDPEEADAEALIHEARAFKGDAS